MVVEACPWLASWYENSEFISIPVTEFDVRTISFTYGDSHPTFSDKITDERETERNFIPMTKFYR